MNEKKFISNKSKLPIGAISFLVVVIVSTLGLFLYNKHLGSVNLDILEKINKSELTIKELSNNDRLQVFDLIEANKVAINELTKRTKVTEYISHLNAISEKYNIGFEGFKLSAGNIQTSALVESTEDGGIAYTKVINFIKNYRIEEKSLFNLDFVNSIEGMDSMKFNVSFNIK